MVIVEEQATDLQREGEMATPSNNLGVCRNEHPTEDELVDR